MPDDRRGKKIPFGPARVSYHAVTRYLQRIRGVTITETFADHCNEAHAHCDAAGVTLEEVRHLIWTKGVAMAIEQGFRQIGTSEFIVIVSIDGTVVTICEPHSKPQLRKLKIRSSREQVNEAHRLNRRKRATYCHQNQED